jgi:hypothetical protein
MYDPWRCPECGAFYRQRPVDSAPPRCPSAPAPTPKTTTTYAPRCTCPIERVRDMRFGICPVHDVTVTM